MSRKTLDPKKDWSRKTLDPKKDCGEDMCCNPEPEPYKEIDSRLNQLVTTVDRLEDFINTLDGQQSKVTCSNSELLEKINVVSILRTTPERLLGVNERLLHLLCELENKLLRY